MNRSRQRLLNHVFLFEMGQSRVESFKCIEIIKDCFDHLIDDFIGHFAGTYKCGCDTVGWDILVDSPINTTGNDSLTVVTSQVVAASRMLPTGLPATI